MKLSHDTGYFTISDSGKRSHHHHSFEQAAYTAHRRSDIERVIEIERVIVNGQVTTRERDITTRTLDFISTI